MEQARLEALLFSLVPADGASIGTQALRKLFEAQVSGDERALFDGLKQSLVGKGRVVTGRGRGGSLRRAPQGSEEDFSLQAQSKPEAPAAPRRTAVKQSARATQRSGKGSGEPQVLSYRHTDRRRNNPEVGMVNPATDPDDGENRWCYDPHIDPALQCDFGRAQVEKLIDDALIEGERESGERQQALLAVIDKALASDDSALMSATLTALKERLQQQAQTTPPERDALRELRRSAAPYLNWSGKAERTSFEVDTVSLHVHERIDPASILAAVRKRLKEGNSRGAEKAMQPDLFAAPFENLPLRDAIDFYHHEKGWSNRLIAGDSLQVMNSLLQKEGMAGQVQMIYIDPPYGIKYGSNFQPFVNKRDVKDRKDEDLTQEPEMIKAFRDTWELGIHSYLTYLRDRLLLSRELLGESGSVFVQISDENVHHVRELLDELFGPKNVVSVITFKKTSGAGSFAGGTNVIPATVDYLVWYAKDIRQIKYRQIFKDKEIGGAGSGAYTWIQELSGKRRRGASPKYSIVLLKPGCSEQTI